MATGEYIRHHVYVDVVGGYMWIAEDDAGELYFPVRPSCAALEVDSTTALETIKADSRLNTGLRKIRLPTEKRGEQEQQCLASTEYSWWLALIDPRRFAEERRPLLQERQRVLMSLSREVMLRQRDLRSLARAARRAGTIETSGDGLEGRMRCQKCGAPHTIVIDGAGWHVHMGVEVE